MCPSLDKRRCQDSIGGVYGVLCDTNLIGTVITTSGKLKREEDERDLEEASLLGERDGAALEGRELMDREIDARTFTGTFDGCGGYCSNYDKKLCLAVSYNAGVSLNSTDAYVYSEMLTISSFCPVCWELHGSEHNHG